MAIEQDTNNPLGLTVNRAGQSLYPGQVGDQTSGLGVDFAAFPDPSTGFAAGVDYIERHIGSGQVTTVGQLVALFGPSDQNAFTAAGLPASAPLNVANSAQYAALIATGEGNKSMLGDLTSVIGGLSGSVGATGQPSGSGAAPSGPLGVVAAYFQRGGLIVVGALIVLVALGCCCQAMASFPRPPTLATSSPRRRSPLRPSRNRRHPAMTTNDNGKAADHGKAKAGAKAADKAAADKAARDAEDAVIGDLGRMDTLARAQGHSLVAIIAKAARDAFGIDVTPDTAPEPADPADEDEDA